MFCPGTVGIPPCAECLKRRGTTDGNPQTGAAGKGRRKQFLCAAGRNPESGDDRTGEAGASGTAVYRAGRITTAKAGRGRD